MGKFQSGKKHPMWGKKNPILTERNKQQIGEKNPMFGKTGEKNPMFGKHHSQESKDKMSQFHIGLQVGEKNPFYGKHHTQKTKDKISKAMIGENNYWYGKSFTQEHKNKMGNSRMGEKNHMFGKKNPIRAALNRQQVGEKHGRWKGGVSKELYTFEFTDKLKKSIRQRDNFTCQKCGLPEIEEIDNRRLAIHHINYNKKDCTLSNLITLCNRCNNKVNFNCKKWTQYFQKKMTIEYEQKQLCLARL